MEEIVMGYLASGRVPLAGLTAPIAAESVAVAS
jgi:hypothetical protein